LINYAVVGKVECRFDVVGRVVAVEMATDQSGAAAGLVV